MSVWGDAEERFTLSQPMGKTRVWRVEYRALLDEDRMEEGAPHLLECRFAVLPFSKGGAVDPGTGEEAEGTFYAIFDRWLSRVVDGMYFDAEDALRVAGNLNKKKQVGLSQPPVVHLLYPDMEDGPSPWEYWLTGRDGAGERNEDVSERGV
jgi:hypothetical protein